MEDELLDFYYSGKQKSIIKITKQEGYKPVCVNIPEGSPRLWEYTMCIRHGIEPDCLKSFGDCVFIGTATNKNIVFCKYGMIPKNEYDLGYKLFD